MENLYYVGLDVHKETVEISVFRNMNQEPEFEKQLPNSEEKIISTLKRLQKEGTVEVCYEAGCMGFTLQRKLSKAGISSRIVSPGKIPRKPGDKIKTDRRDARILARTLRSGEANGIHIPEPEDEATRDYIRARDDVKQELKRVKKQLLHFLLRHGYKYDEKRYWTGMHRTWMKNLTFPQEMQKETFNAYYFRLLEIEEKLRQMDNRIEKIALTERYAMQVNSLRCFKGIDYLTALSFVCEIGDFQRFATAEAFMSYLGLVPGEHSSGDKRRQGGITKSGNSHLRMLVIEASWHYRYKASPGKGLKKRRVGQDVSIISYADRALNRLQKKFTKLVFRGKSPQVSVTAVSRELSGFIWGMMTNNMA